MFGPSPTREYSDFIPKVSAHVLSTTMTSADFSICNPYSPRPPSVRRISLCLCLLHLLFRHWPLSRCWTSAACGTSSDLIASVCSFCSSVQTPRLAYFSVWITPNHLATCLASGHDPSAYGTFTLWITQFHELNSPFKAHTYDMNACLTLLFETDEQIRYFRSN